MSTLLTSEEFLKDKYMFNLVSHNLLVDEPVFVTDDSNYIFVIGKLNKEIWLWTKNNISEDVIDEIINKLDNIINDSDLEFVCKKDVYERIVNKYKFINNDIFIYDNYVCEEIIEPDSVSGSIYKPTLVDIDILADMWKENCEHFGYDTSLDVCNKMVASWINAGSFYAWKDNDSIVSFIGFDIIDDTAEISHAYTKPSERGKGYMPVLISKITKIILEMGLKPVLNTDYKYESSNKAYKKIGFKETELLFKFKTSKHLDRSL